MHIDKHSLGVTCDKMVKLLKYINYFVTISATKC